MRRRVLTSFLTLALIAGAAGPSSAQLPDVQLPDVDVPPIEVPEVRVPEVAGVPLPEVKVPSVQVPEVQVPSVEVPGVRTPEISAGGVEVGGVDVGGSDGGGGGTGGGGAPAATGTPDATAPAGGTGTPRRSAAAGGGAVTGRGGEGGGGTTAPAGGQRSAAPDGAAGRRAAGRAGSGEGSRSRPRERRLRRLVRASRGCLGVLPAAERRVLVLRAGVGPRDPRSRRATAVALGVALATVRRREQAGVRHLRALDGSCGGAVGRGGEAFTLAAASPGGADGAGPAGPEAGDGGRGARDGREAAEGGVLGESEVMPDAGGAPDVRAAIFPGTLPSDGGDAALYVLAALALTLLGLTANRRSREWILHPYD